MSPEAAGFLCIGILSILLVAGIPMGVSMMLAGGVGFLVLGGIPPATAIIKVEFFKVPATYLYACIPLFVLMGELAIQSGVAKLAFDAMSVWVGQLKGGLASASIMACALFAASSGSSLTTAVTIGKMAIPEMLRRGYSPQLATGSCAAGGTLGCLIPPSILMVVYSSVTGVSLGPLLMAGFLPGILSAGMYIALISVWVWRRPEIGPAVPPVAWRERFTRLRGLTPFIFLAVGVMGSIYSGLATPTEAGAVGAVLTLLLCVVMRRISGRSTWEATRSTVMTTAMVIILMIGAHVFSKFMAISNLATILSQWVVGLSLNRWLVFTALCIMYILLVSRQASI